MNGNDIEAIRDIINKRDRLTKEDIREVVREELVRIGISAKTDAEAVRTQNAFGFLFRVSRAVNSVTTKILMAVILVAIGSVIVGSDTIKGLLGIK